MKTKIGYLNFILTVCAITLTVIALQNAEIIPKVHASAGYGFALNEKGELPVKIMNSTMDVNLVDISTSDELDINIDEVGGHSCYYDVPVTIKKNEDK